MSFGSPRIRHWPMPALYPEHPDPGTKHPAPCLAARDGCFCPDIENGERSQDQRQYRYQDRPQPGCRHPTP
jgi:hypothetical protein